MNRREGAWAWSEYESYVMTIWVMGYAYGCTLTSIYSNIRSPGDCRCQVRLSERASTTGTNLILTFHGDLLIRRQLISCSHAHHDIKIPVDKMFLFVMFHSFFMVSSASST